MKKGIFLIMDTVTTKVGIVLIICVAMLASGLELGFAVNTKPESDNNQTTMIPVPIAQTVTAKPTTSTVLINGQNMAFDAYNINDNNYFKLRDLAYAINNTEKQFAVDWDAANNAISLISGQSYTVVGGEMTGKGDGAKVVMPTDSKIVINGTEAKLTAYYIEGNNYFKLREIGEAIDFGVHWDGVNNTIIIDTKKRYESETSQAALPLTEPVSMPANYIIDEDYKEGNGLASYNKVYQAGEWIYFAEFSSIYRINVNGGNLTKLFDADLGLQRGAGVHSITQCGEYLVFSHGSYIYKMNFNTLKREILVNAEDQNTCFRFDIKDNTVYFVGTEGGFTDGVYKININGGQTEKIFAEEKGTAFYNIQIYDNQIFYSIQQDWLYRVNLNGSNKTKIIDLGAGSSDYSWGRFTISDGYIYVSRNDYSLQRADINGENIATFVSSCSDFIIRDDWIIYSELAIDNNYYYGMNVYKMRTDKTGFKKIYDGGLNLYGSCGNWIYFSDPNNSSIFRIRLDGTGKMAMNN